MSDLSSKFALGWMLGALTVAALWTATLAPKPAAVASCVPSTGVVCTDPKPQKPKLPDICYVDPANNMECPNP